MPAPLDILAASLQAEVPRVMRAPASDLSVAKDGSLIKGVATPILSGRYRYGQGTSPAEPQMSVSMN